MLQNKISQYAVNVVRDANECACELRTCSSEARVNNISKILSVDSYPKNPRIATPAPIILCVAIGLAQAKNEHIRAQDVEGFYLEVDAISNSVIGAAMGFAFQLRTLFIDEEKGKNRGVAEAIVDEVSKLWKFHKPNVLILHFIAHGKSDSSGIPCGNDCQDVIDDKCFFAINDGLYDSHTHVRGLVINACSSLKLAEKTSSKIYFSIGHDGALFRASSIAFARVFYRGICDGFILTKAFEAARNNARKEQNRRIANKRELGSFSFGEYQLFGDGDAKLLLPNRQENRDENYGGLNYRIEMSQCDNLENNSEFYDEDKIPRRIIPSPSPVERIPYKYAVKSTNTHSRIKTNLFHRK